MIVSPTSKVTLKLTANRVIINFTPLDNCYLYLESEKQFLDFNEEDESDFELDYIKPTTFYSIDPHTSISISDS